MVQRGVPRGWPLKLTAEKKAAVLAMRGRGDLTMSQLARAVGVGRTILYDHLDLPPLDDTPVRTPTTSWRHSADRQQGSGGVGALTRCRL